jgi:hypothetical protein
LDFAKRHLKDSQIIRNKILWSNETKIDLLSLNAKCHVWRKYGIIPMVKHGGDSNEMKTCSKPQTGAKVHLPTGKPPSAHSQDNTGVASGQVSECP